MQRDDGYQIEDLTIQGVRAYDPIIAQWTTPDAYKGDVHDPMSQKPYMWNNNSPVMYSDPSGYEGFCAGCQGQPYPSKCNDACQIQGATVDFQAVTLFLPMEFPEAVAANVLERFGGPLLEHLLGSFGSEAPRMSSQLMEAATKTDRLFDISGTATVEEANAMGRLWVGNDATLSESGNALTSADGSRVYRFPSFKRRFGSIQANFVKMKDGKVVSNGHLNIMTRH